MASRHIKGIFLPQCVNVHRSRRQRLWCPFNPDMAARLDTFSKTDLFATFMG
jgi:hypothetical protein